MESPSCCKVNTDAKIKSPINPKETVRSDLVGRALPSSPFRQQDDLDQSNLYETISCSSDASQEYILDRLTQIKNNEHASNVVLKDLIISNHLGLLPLVKALAIGSGRRWENFQFVDDIDLASFVEWQIQRDAIIADFERTHYDSDGSTSFWNIITWQTNVKIARGSSAEDILDFLKAVQNDDEIYSVKVGVQVSDKLAILSPDALCQRMDKQTLQLLDTDILVEVACGWVLEEDSWLELLDSCIADLSRMIELSSLGQHNHTTKEALIASTQRSCESTEESTVDDELSPLHFSRNLKDSRSFAGNFSMKSAGASFSAYPSFYEGSFLEASTSDLGNASKGKLSPTLPSFPGNNADDLSFCFFDESTGKLSALADVPRIPKAA